MEKTKVSKFTERTGPAFEPVFFCLQNRMGDFWPINRMGGLPRKSYGGKFWPINRIGGGISRSPPRPSGWSVDPVGGGSCQ